MLTRMITRMLFKVCLSLGLLLGVVSYGHYLSGGDPGAIWSRVAGGMGSGFSRTWDKMQDGVSQPVQALAGSESQRDHVYSWRDADGVMHFTTEPPTDGREATRVSVNPNTNVLAPVPVPAPRARGAESEGAIDARGQAGGGTTQRASGRTSGGTDRRAARDSEAAGAFDDMPGIGGAILRARGDKPAPDPARAEALLKLLQSPSD